MAALTRGRENLGPGGHLLLACAALLLPLGLGNLARKALDAPPSDAIRWEASSEGLRVGWAPPALELAAGDRLVLVENVAVMDRLGLAFALDSSRPGDSLRYVFERTLYPPNAAMTV